MDFPPLFVECSENKTREKYMLQLGLRLSLVPPLYFALTLCLTCCLALFLTVSAAEANTGEASASASASASVSNADQSLTFTAANSANDRLEKVTLQLLWTHQFEFAGFYAAQELGFYREEGFEVLLKPLVPGMNPVEEVVSGRADFGVSNSEVILALSQGQPVSLLANLFKHSPLVVLARRDSAIRHPKDLHQKRLMTSELDLHSAEISYMLASESVDLGKIYRYEHNYEVKDLLLGHVDAMTAYITNQPFQLQEQGVDYVVIDPANYGADFYSNTLFTHALEAQNNPERVEAFRRASIRGWRYALDHPHEMVEIIQTKYPSNKSRAALLFEAREISKLVAADVYPLGSIDLNRIQRLLNVYREIGQLTSTPDLSPYIWREALNAHKSGYLHQQTLNFSVEEKNFLNSLPMIRMCVTPHWMPYEGIDDKGHHIGIAAEVMDLLSASLGKPFKLIRTANWSESLQAVKERRCDILSAAANIQERRQFLNFTKNYLSFPNVIITRKQHSFINHISELNGKQVGVVKDYYQASVLQSDFPNINAIPVNNVAQGLELVSKGQLDAFVGAIASTGYYIQQKGLTNLHIAGYFPKNIQLAVAVRNDWPQLLTALEKSVNALRPTDLQGIFQRWVGITAEPRLNYTLLWQLSFIAVVIVSVVLVANRKLKCVNEELTREVEERARMEWKLKELNLQLEYKNQRLHELSTTDSLTGLRNRYYVESSLENNLLTATVKRQAFSILLLDLDHFKQVNDRYGHGVGDDVLVQFSTLLKQSLKPQHIAGRWGGEEFLVLLPGYNRHMAQIFAEDFRQQVEQTLFPEVEHITISVGLAEALLEEAPNYLVHRADNALYQAKSMGRNCVVVADRDTVAFS
ncbi:MAG: hypothetical protein CMI12_06605 [Oceanospirillum sp.]|nr:hypothetical protein [Oceanospirillum sp.]